MERMLIYVDLSDGVVLILEHTGDKLDDLVGNYGSDLEDWPEDLGAYSESTGLHIWEGTIDEEEHFDGKIRSLNLKEWNHVTNNERVVSDD